MMQLSAACGPSPIRANRLRQHPLTEILLLYRSVLLCQTAASLIPKHIHLSWGVSNRTRLDHGDNASGVLVTTRLLAMPSAIRADRYYQFCWCE